MIEKNTFKPFVGILTSMNTNNRIDGNKALFQKIQQTLLTQRGASFLFTPSSFKENEIDGIFYLPQKKKWVKISCPYPNLVYNRIPNRKDEETPITKQVVRTLQDREIPLFNSHFFHKHDIYQILKRNNKLLPHLPKTILGNQWQTFLHFLSTYKKVYAKPTKQAKGTGIFLLTYVSEEKVIYQAIDSTPFLMNIAHAWEMLQVDEYILQEAITCNTINNRRYDLRILVHYLKGAFVISGIGVRLGKEDSITTHVLHGGEVISNSIIPIHQETIQFLATTCGSLLQQAYGAIYEFSLDIGIKGNQYYIFEINSKPMTFDEPSIQEIGLKNLIQVFQEQAVYFHKK